MYNLHCHSLLSDGALLPSEIAVRFAVAGYQTIAITDHVDYSNIEPVTSALMEFCRRWPRDAAIKVLPGIELTHLPLAQFRPLAKYARAKGIKVIIGHGETAAEPVAPGANRACLEADIDILAHPGMISEADVRLAKERNIFLELTSRKGHCDSNKHVARQALELGAKLILSLDAHQPEDIISPQELEQIGIRAGLAPQYIAEISHNVTRFLQK